MICTDKKQLVKLVSAFATFDGGLYKTGRNKNARFIMNMRAVNADYIEMVARTLENITSVLVTERKGYKRQPQIRLESKAHPFFTKIHSRVYIDRKKVIDPHMLKLMDAEMLAIIFMAKGGLRVYNSDVSLNTKGFSYGDNLLLSKAIYRALGIRTTVNRQNQRYYLRVKSADHLKFIHTVMPYVAPSFRYKIERLAPRFGDEVTVWTPWKHGDVIGN